jgi:hypothetical protein
MKSILAPLALITLIAQPVRADEVAATLDVAKLNQRLEAVIQETVQENDVVTGLFLRLDEQKTNLDYEAFRLKGDVGGTVVRTPWDATQPTTISFGLDAKAANVGSAAATVGAQISASAKTDTLKLINFLSRKLIADAPSSEASKDEQRAKELVTELATVQTLDRTYAIFEELRTLVQNQEEYREVQVDVLASLKDGKVDTIVVRADLGDEMSFFRVTNIVFELRISATQAKAGLKFRTEYPAEAAETVAAAKQALIDFADGAQNDVYTGLKGLIEQMKALLQQLADEAA